MYAFDNELQNGAKEHMPAYEMKKVKEISKTEFASFRLAARSGVMIAAGSDTIYKPGGGTIQDGIIAEVKYGSTP